MTDTEIADIRFCAGHFRHLVLVINCGSSIDMAFADEDAALLPILNIDPSAFRTVAYTYEAPPIYKDETVREFVAKLSIKEMAELVVGA